MTLTLKVRVDPKGWGLTPALMKATMVQVITDEATAIQADFKGFADWPEWPITIEVGETRVAGEVGTNDRIVNWLSNGTKSHTVGSGPPRRKMAFVPKGGSGVLVRTGPWQVGGIEPGHFDEVVAKKSRGRLQRRAVAALRKATT